MSSVMNQLDIEGRSPVAAALAVFRRVRTHARSAKPPNDPADCYEQRDDDVRSGNAECVVREAWTVPALSCDGRKLTTVVWLLRPCPRF